MAKRHKDALEIVDGACNPRAIVNSIRAAIEELDEEAWRGRMAALPEDATLTPVKNALTSRADTPTICTDPAIRLMVYQLAHITNALRFEHPLNRDFELAMSACEEKSS